MRQTSYTTAKKVVNGTIVNFDAPARKFGNINDSGIKLRNSSISSTNGLQRSEKKNLESKHSFTLAAQQMLGSNDFERFRGDGSIEKQKADFGTIVGVAPS